MNWVMVQPGIGIKWCLRQMNIPSVFLCWLCKAYYFCRFVYLYLDGTRLIFYSKFQLASLEDVQFPCREGHRFWMVLFTQGHSQAGYWHIPPGQNAVWRFRLSFLVAWPNLTLFWKSFSFLWTNLTSGQTWEIGSWVQLWLICSPVCLSGPSSGMFQCQKFMKQLSNLYLTFEGLR